jgi:hypothetical protein
MHRLLRAVKKEQCHPIARGQSDQLSRFFRAPETFRASNNPIELLEQFNLFVHQQSRITDYVDE